MSDPITVVFSTDERYLAPTYVAIYSMLSNHSGPRTIGIYILASGGYPTQQQDALRELVTRFGNASISFIDMGEAYSTVSMNALQIATPTMYRLTIPRLLGDVDRCVYLDSDLVVEGDIAELFDVDLGEKCVGGVRDCEVYLGSDGWRSVLGIPTLTGYINSGVLLMDLQRIRNLHLDVVLERSGYNDEYRYNDQDAINVTFYGEIRELAIRYNALWHYVVRAEREIVSRYGREDILEARADPVVVHFAGETKPWECGCVVGAGRWWRFANMLDEGTKREVIVPYAESHRAPLRTHMREACKSLLMHMGLYGSIRDLLNRTLA